MQSLDGKNYSNRDQPDDFEIKPLPHPSKQDDESLVRKVHGIGKDKKTNPPNVVKVKKSSLSTFCSSLKQSLFGPFSRKKTEEERPPVVLLTSPKNKEIEPELTQDLVGAVLDCNLRVWYPALREFTFPTIELQVSKEEMQAMVAVHNSRRKDGKPDPNDYAAVEKLKQAESLCKELEQKLDRAIREIGGRAFVKLETRSPKDAVYEVYSDRTARILRHFLSELAPRPTENKNEGSAISQESLLANNDELVAFYKACGMAMSVQSGIEAQELLLSSSRINHDLRHSLERSQLTSLVVRGWQEIPLDREFRLFIHNGQLTGASQYFDMCYFPGLVEDRKEIENALKTFWEQARSLVPSELKSYIMDIAFDKNGKPFIIELNPFTIGTGVPFYSWKTGSEGRERLLNGPYELRVLEKPLPDAKERWLVGRWEKFINQERQA